LWAPASIFVHSCPHSLPAHLPRRPHPPRAHPITIGPGPRRGRRTVAAGSNRLVGTAPGRTVAPAPGHPDVGRGTLAVAGEEALLRSVGPAHGVGGGEPGRLPPVASCGRGGGSGVAAGRVVALTNRTLPRGLVKIVNPCYYHWTVSNHIKPDKRYPLRDLELC
jgi:hypothetical protein